MPDDNDKETPDPDGDGNLPDDGDSAELLSGNSGEDGGRITLQQAIATLNNLLAMCGSVTRG